MAPSRPRLVLGVVLALGLPTAGPAAAGSFALRDGARVVFFGDSITQAGFYANDVEIFLLTRFPNERFRLFNHGISSETISGTSESDHLPRRPHALPRFTRDVAAWRPDVVVACFGMNDGNYFPFDPERFARYQDGVRTLIARTRDEAHATLYLLSPPPYDPYRRRVIDAEAKEFGYKYPAIDYDDTLERYSRWLLDLRGEGRNVVDVHGLLAEHLRRRRKSRVSVFLSGDGVHPGPTGHWLMAQALLLAWQAPAACAEATIDAKGLAVKEGAVRDLEREGKAIALTWRSPLPFPPHSATDPRALALERTAERLNRYRLTIEGLDAGRYRLLARLEGDASEAEVGEFDRAELAAGIDLSAQERFPTVVLARQVRAIVEAGRQAAYDRWRQRIARPVPDEPPTSMTEDDDPSGKARRLCRERDVRVRLVPIGGR